MNSNTIVMGIDPSMRSTGICIWDGESHTYYLVAAHPTKKLQNFQHPKLKVLAYEPSPVAGKTSVGKEDAITSNIESVVIRIEEVIKTYHPEYIVIESCAFGAAGRVADLSGLNHCIRLSARRLNVPIFAVPPTTNKMKFTGNGQATKDMMVASWKVCDRTANELCSIGKGPDDLADAFALCHFPKNDLALQ